MQQVIEVTVRGLTGSGKTEVLKVIENALSQYYGPATQIASNDLRAAEKMVPRGDVLSDAKVTGQTCRGNTVFVLLEENVPRQRSAPASQGEDSEDVEALGETEGGEGD